MKKNKKFSLPFAVAGVDLPQSTILRMRLSAGKHAVSATEAEVRVDGARLAGGTGTFEFDLFNEAWIEIHIIRS